MSDKIVQSKIVSNNLVNLIGVPKVTHVFLIASPVISMVARMYISKYKISEDSLMFISLRNFSTDFFEMHDINSISLFSSQFVNRLSREYSLGYFLKWKLNRTCEKYIIYGSWFDKILSVVTKSKNCIGHVYLEEGQMSYYKSKPFRKADNLSFRYRIKMSNCGHQNFYYRDDALAYIGISSEAFPKISSDKKLILDDFQQLLDYYKPKLVGEKKISITPAPHRIHRKLWFDAIDVYIKAMGECGVIKLHPGFEIYSELRDDIINHVKDMGVSVTVCDKKTIIELEMLAESKKIFGIRSSLEYYAKIFGSDFTILMLPGYIPPSN